MVALRHKLKLEAVVTALVGVSVLQGVLKHDGVSLGVVYGIYPVTAQLIASAQSGR